MFKKYLLFAIEGIGALMMVATGLSGAFMYFFLSGRPSVDNPTIIWFAPLFLTPIAFIGAALMLASSLISEQHKRLVSWSCVVYAILLGATAATFNLTGLSTGEVELVGTFWGTTAVTISGLYAAAMVVIGAIGLVVARAILIAPVEHDSGTTISTA